MDAGPTTSVQLDTRLIEAVQALAVRTGRQGTQVIEDAVRAYLAMREAVLTQESQLEVSEALDEDEAMHLAYAELHVMRRERRHT